DGRWVLRAVPVRARRIARRRRCRRGRRLAQNASRVQGQLERLTGVVPRGPAEGLLELLVRAHPRMSDELEVPGRRLGVRDAQAPQELVDPVEEAERQRADLKPGQLRGLLPGHDAVARDVE